MNQRFFYALLIVLFALVACTPITAPAPAASNEAAAAMPEKLRFAVTDLQGLEELQRDFGAFRDALQEALGVEIEFFPVSDRAAAAVALQSQQVDLVLTGPAEYVVIRARTNAVPVIGLERPNYKSIVVVHGDSGIATPADLKGKKIAMTDVGSTSGHLGPSQALLDNGVNPLTEMEVLTVGSAVYQAFINRDVDAMGINFLQYERFLASEGLTTADAPILIEGRLLPNDIFVASAELPATLVAEIKEKLLANEEAIVAAITAAEGNAKYVGGGLTEVTDADYDYVRSMYKAVGVDDFNEFIGD
ncbi:MAG: phosphate/phosphite/phosphonate ABC transporter substrate-binding protein [Caldilineaceae bacterium]